MDTPDLINIPPGQWVNLNTLSGIAVGSDLLVQVYQCNSQIDGSIASVQPAPGARNKFAMYRYHEYKITETGTSPFWVYSSTESELSVQEIVEPTP